MSFDHRLRDAHGQPIGPIWAIGDLQGCAQPLRDLLAQPELAGADCQYWFAGDLVNRGPDSLATLRHIIGLGRRAISILGNHDLHLLAVAAGFRAPGRSDTFQDVLDAPDADELITWLRHRPLMHRAHGYTMVHAGIAPGWTLDEAQARAHEVESALRSPQWREALQGMYGDTPTTWQPSLTGDARRRVIINSFTRMRMCTVEGEMNLRHKGSPREASGVRPWFDVPPPAPREDRVIFGHWSTLGLLLRPDVICLDTGCVWGRWLTALRLGDHRIVQQGWADHTPSQA